MKRYIIGLFVVMISAACFAQFDPQIGHYMVFPTAYNPAAAGEGDMMKVAGAHRMQYVGINNAPMTTWFSFTSPFVIGKTRHGVGVRFMNDRFGLFTNQTFFVEYAYRQKLGKGYLAIGVDLGFINVGFKGDSVNLSKLSGSDYFYTDDDVIPKSSKSGMSFDMGVGLQYSTSIWWVGASYSHVTMPKVDIDDKTDVTVRGTMYVTGGYKYRFKNNRNWMLQPSAILMSDFRSWDLNLTLMCDYKDRFRWGAGYDVAGSVNVLLGVDIISGLQLGYTCEFPTGKLMRESYGSHEIYLAYSFDILKPKRTNKYKSVRYL